MKVIVDTSFLVSLTNPREQQHHACVQVAESLQEPMIVPVTVLPEATYFIARRLSHRAMTAFVGKLQHPNWLIENLTSSDLERSHQILKKYGDAELDFVDSSLVAIAERLNVTTVLTLDQRDFRMIRPSHVEHFTILPLINRTE